MVEHIQTLKKKTKCIQTQFFSKKEILKTRI